MSRAASTSFAERAALVLRQRRDVGADVGRREPAGHRADIARRTARARQSGRSSFTGTSPAAAISRGGNGHERRMTDGTTVGDFMALHSHASRRLGVALARDYNKGL